MVGDQTGEPEGGALDEDSDVIRFQNVSVNYRNRTALQGITGGFRRSTLTAVIGPNGGGKTTLLKTIVGLLPVTSGQVVYDAWIKNSIAYLPQLSHIDRNFPLTVQDLVASGFCPRAGMFKRLTQDKRDAIDQALQDVGMGGYAGRTLHSLSGGQFQRVLFARLALQDAKCILLDEPFTAMDAYTVSDLVAILFKWRDAGKTLIVVNHDLDLVQDHFPETVLVVREVLAWGKSQDVITDDNLRRAQRISRELEIPQAEREAKNFDGAHASVQGAKGYNS